MESKQKKVMSRRDFMKAAGTTAAGVVAGSLLTTASRTRAFASPNVVGANDRINYGIIGVGGMGFGHLNTLVRLEDSHNVKIMAVSDVFDKRRERARAALRLPRTWTYDDYRNMLERDDIDVIVIATPDHWHAKISVEAMEAGKHVIVEKPMTRTLEEAYEVYDTAKKTKRLLQVNSQFSTDSKWHKAGELVSSGRIGKVIWAQGGFCRNNPHGEWNYRIDPDANDQNVDWKKWLGDAPDMPWSPERYFRWRKYWDYGTGIIGDLWPHRLHPLLIAMNLDDFPAKVACIGTNPCNTDEGHGEPREVAEATLLQVEYPNGEMIFLAGSTVNERGVEDMIRGQKGNLYFGGDRVRVEPERPFSDEVQASDETVDGPGGSHTDHHINFIQSVRGNETLNCPVDLGLKVQVVVNMAEKSYRESKMVQLDTARRRIF